MSFFFEFPHTRTYDSDLGWLIHAYQLLKAQADDIQNSIQPTTCLGKNHTVGMTAIK